MRLGIRTDSALVQLVLCSETGEVIERIDWQADRTLARHLLRRLVDLLERHDASFGQLQGLIVFKGPGSFTGLRIGLSVMNTLAYSEHLPIVGSCGDDWLELGLKRLANDENDQVVLPEYGADARITSPKK